MSFKRFYIALITLPIIFLLVSLGYPVQNNKLPSVQLEDLEGNIIDSKTFNNNGAPTIITFWATWCKCCEGELNTLNDLYPEWEEETGVRIIAISVDDERTKRIVGPTVDASGWEFDFYLDPNGEFKRLMGVNTPPHMFILDQNNEIVYSHQGYVPGDEYEVYDKLLEIVE